MRSFSMSITPMTFPCGHSLCEECSDGMRKCPLCRKKFLGTARSTNYSMVSLLEKLERLDKKEFKDAQVQTEKRVPRSKSANNKVFPAGYTGYGPVLIPTVLAAIVKITRIQSTLAGLVKNFNSNVQL